MKKYILSLLVFLLVVIMPNAGQLHAGVIDNETMYIDLGYDVDVINVVHADIYYLQNGVQLKTVVSYLHLYKQDACNANFIDLLIADSNIYIYDYWQTKIKATKQLGKSSIVNKRPRDGIRYNRLKNCS